jgi:tRNA A-37 threonylcarbamoyl transferase component Bud32
VDRSYELYCLADRLFYDSPTIARRNDPDFDAARDPVPAGWERSELEDWLVYVPGGIEAPPQGWKIHVSASLSSADEILSRVWAYCLPRHVPFKFIRSRELLLMANSKYADRGSSGKFITIYPRDDSQFELILVELGAVLNGLPGPYILSDLRWGEGPLYVRYGGFAERYCIGAGGTLEAAIEDPNGRLVPDRREPTFSLPPWVTLPDFLAPHLAARGNSTTAEMPYEIQRALHFSNGGGLYVGVDKRTGKPVVLKEARPYAGLAVDGSDAVSRLDKERHMLERLAGLDLVPAVNDAFTLGEHLFLVLEMVEGTALSDLIVDRFPVTGLEPGGAAVAEYTAWAIDICGRLEDAVATAHERGVVIGDLHPSNVLVRPDGRIVLIDLETATEAGAGQRPTLGNPAFAASDRVGFDADRYALACLRLFMFLPLTALIALDQAKAAEMAADIAEAFPVPLEFLSQAVGVIAGRKDQSEPGVLYSKGSRGRIEPDPPGWHRVRDSMARAILASATPDREDRLFPGDIQQFTTGGLNLAFGAAGVLLALAATGVGRFPEHEDWLVREATDPRPGTRLGLYEGLHGVAYALDSLDRPSDAMKVLDICVEELRGKWHELGLDLYAGLSGIGLNLAHFASTTGEPALWANVKQVAEVVANRLGDEEAVPTISGGKYPYAGLLRGSSGPALLFLRLYEHFADDALLDLAATALRQDLRRCFVREDGSMEVDEGWRTMPYLAEGSIGIGMVLDEMLRHRQEERFIESAAAIRMAAQADFYIEPGLFNGRAGMILYLSRDRRPGTPAPDPVVAGHIRRLGWHAMTYEGGIAFPGEQLLRLSMDLGTGTAGVLLALGAALHDDPPSLPFFGRSRADRESIGGVPQGRTREGSPWKAEGR